MAKPKNCNTRTLLRFIYLTSVHTFQGRPSPAALIPSASMFRPHCDPFPDWRPQVPTVMPSLGEVLGDFLPRTLSAVATYAWVDSHHIHPGTLEPCSVSGITGLAQAASMIDLARLLCVDGCGFVNPFSWSAPWYPVLRADERHSGSPIPPLRFALLVALMAGILTGRSAKN
jgi:hypothetical protein